MPSGYPKPVKWTQKQREIYHMVVTQGKTRDEVYEAGYGGKNIDRVMRSIFRKDMPPRYDPSEESLTASMAGTEKEKPLAASTVKGNGHKPPTPTTNVEHAVVATLKPRDAVVFSSLLWQAKKAAIKVFGWPKDMTDSEFVDKWFKKSFLAFGVHIGDYWVEPTVKIAAPHEDQEEEEDYVTATHNA